MALPDGTTITWYGHSVVRIDTAGGKTVIIDPFFENPKSPIKADAVDRCDVLLVTHGHDDHMGDAVALASRLRPAWPCIHEMSLWLATPRPGVGGPRGRGRPAPAGLVVHPREEPVAGQAAAGWLRRRDGHEQGRHVRGRGT